MYETTFWCGVVLNGLKYMCHLCAQTPKGFWYVYMYAFRCLYIICWEPEGHYQYLNLDVLLRTRRVLSLYKVYGDSALLVLNRTSFNNWWRPFGSQLTTCTRWIIIKKVMKAVMYNVTYRWFPVYYYSLEITKIEDCLN